MTDIEPDPSPEVLAKLPKASTPPPPEPEHEHIDEIPGPENPPLEPPDETPQPHGGMAVAEFYGADL